MSAEGLWDETILIVDDNPENIRFLASLLDSEGYSIRAATSGQAALDSVETQPPDLILLDVMMPGMDGFETLRRIKALPGGDSIPVIFLTGKTGEDETLRGFEEGAVDFVGKPFQPMELLSRIRTHLTLRRHTKTIERIQKEQQALLRLMTHDLAGNLGAMDSMAMLAGKDPGMAVEFVESARRDISLCLDIVKLVRKIMELEYDRMQLVLEEANLGVAVRETLGLLHEDLQKKEIKVIEDIKYSGSVCAEHVTLVTTVLRNVIHNAMKFTPRGGTIHIESNEIMGFAELSITDSGTGIAPSLGERAFLVDRNSSTPGTESETGSGYGLFLAGRFMEAYKAFIAFDPDTKSGTTVRMRFRIP